MNGLRRDVKILDCTLRDGGYVNGNVFEKENIASIVSGLQKSKVDLIEYGYIEDKKPISEDKNEYKSFSDLFSITGKENGNILMLLGEKYDVENLPVAPNDECYLRVSFHKKNAEARINKIRKIIEKGYKVYIQPTVTMSYTDDELEKMLMICNDLKPVSVAIVDTFGQMTPDDVGEKARLFDRVLDNDIAISFHAHNNLQNAFANAIRFVDSTSDERKIIIDTSIYGMGRGAGNLPTELMMDYLNKNYGKNYDVDPILNLTDNIIVKYKEKNDWGYSLPYYLSGVYGVHPSYVLAFMERKTLNSGDIKQLINMISDDKKTEFDSGYANELYNAHNNKVVNDDEGKKRLSEMIGKRKILLVGPGKSLEKEKEKIKGYIERNNPFIISINGENDVHSDALFFSNKKRYEAVDSSRRGVVIITSNIGKKNDNRLIFNYETYLAKGYGVSDNALLMLINILKSIGVKEITLAGFDGYSTDGNFYKGSLELLLDKNYVNELNKVIKVNIKKLRDVMVIESITPSRNI